MDAGKRTINDIFNTNRVLEIPYFQRAYVWGEPQWERLLEDMQNVSVSNKPYFMGSVILKQLPTNTGSSVGDIRTVIDGQQRLTTINIFFKVLGLMINNIYISDTLWRLPMQNNDIALKHSHNDVEMFEKVMNLTQLDDLSSYDDNIAKAYTYFAKNIDPSKLDFQRILKNILLVGIDVGVDEDEQQIFDTINSLGVMLTTAELLKNYFFNRDVKSYELYWKDVFEKDENTKKYWDTTIWNGRRECTFIDLFFYAYLQIKIVDPALATKVSTEDKLVFSKVENLFESYKRFIKDYGINTAAMLKEIKEYAILFQENFDATIIEDELPAEAGIERMNCLIFGLDNSTIIPYILYVLKNQSDVNKRSELFASIESYLMRRIIVRANNKGYSIFFADRCIGNKLLTKGDFENYIAQQDGTLAYLPSDSLIKDAFEHVIYNNKTATGILYMIETKIRNKQKQSTQLLGIRKYSLEHMMPKKWRNNWPIPSTPEEIENLDKKLLTIGNLTIITQSLNASIRDADWSTKKIGKGNKGGLLNYAAGIEITTPYLQKTDWTEVEIDSRATDLYNTAITIWK